MALSLKIKDVRGQRFGALSVSIDAVHVSRPSNSAKPFLGAAAYWPAICKCGATIWARGSTLGKATISCGSEKCQIEALTALNRPLGKDLAFTNPPVGEVFGSFSVIGLAERRGKGGQRYWIIRCVCGAVKDFRATGLVRGVRPGCTCHSRETQRLSVTKYDDPLQKCWNDLLRRYKDKAKKRGYSFELSTEEFFQLLKSSCRYCGRIGTTISDWHWHSTQELKIRHNGIDRLDNSLGYIPGNCVSCCQTCNVMKLQMPEQEFISHVRLILRAFKGL